MSRRYGSDLHPQALRLPQQARDRLVGIASHLCAPGAVVTVAEVTRGLCLLTLDLARGAAGPQVADAFRVAASDPDQGNVRNALNAFVSLLDTEPSTMPMRRDLGGPRTHPGAVPQVGRRARHGLHSQALRLPQRARGELKVLAAELRVAGACVSAAEAMRGLCLLALDIVDGAAGADVADAFCVAARDPTDDGTRRAVEALRPHVDGAPSTVPDPPTADGPTPTAPPRDSVPPTEPTRRAA